LSASVKVSIVIPIKGRPELFELTAKSIRNQTFCDWEAIVVDDHSGEEDRKRISAIASGDQRMRVVANPNPRRGAASCRNAGMSLSTGEYVIFLDADDALFPGCLARRVHTMEQNPAVDFAAFASWMFHNEPGDSKKLWNGFNEDDDLHRFLRIDAPWPTHGPIWRKASLARAGLLWDERARSWQDWEFHIRALVVGLRYIKMPEPDCFFRAARPGSVSHASFSASKVVNRARVLARLAAFFEMRGAATVTNRRLLAAQFFRHAFGSGLRRQKAFGVWRMAYRANLVSRFEFYTVLFSRALVWLTARTSRALERFVLPELPSLHAGTHLTATAPWLRKSAGDQPMPTSFPEKVPDEVVRVS